LENLSNAIVGFLVLRNEFVNVQGRNGNSQNIQVKEEHKYIFSKQIFPCKMAPRKEKTFFSLFLLLLLGHQAKKQDNWWCYLLMCIKRCNEEEDFL
jgi:hypothetical protein